jgi:hypothetical protein
MRMGALQREAYIHCEAFFYYSNIFAKVKYEK